MTEVGVRAAPKDPEDAVHIAEHVLELTGRALLKRDFDALRKCFAVPTVVETFEGRRTLKTVDDLRAAFEGVCAHYHGLAMTDLVRRVVAAQFDGADVIRTTHECRVLAGQNLAQAPYAVYSRLEKDGEDWRVAESIYIIDNAPIFTRALSFGTPPRIHEGT
ncbi:MAG: hypothetical protein AAF714_01075 [Pseudomonadota bacterium]